MQSASVTKALSEFNPGVFRAHMAFLADDLLEGRGTGTRGYDIAAKYVATMFESYGLKPAEDKDSFFQRVPFRELTVQPDQCEFVVKREGGEQTLKWGDDYLMRAHELSPNTNVEAPVVFVGYGITAPGRNYDDYAGVDARGKIVAYLAGAPASFPSEFGAHMSSGREKSRNAVAHGAIGTISLMTPQYSKTLPWDRVVIGAAFPALRWIGPDGQPNDSFPQIRGSAVLSLAASEAFFRGAPKNYSEVIEEAKANKLRGFDMPFSVRLHVVGKHRQIESWNVAAVLPGSDPKLKNEYVVYTAHIDHLGVGTPIKGDAIYNGAADNASGTAALIEIAQVFSRLPKAPARSIVFLGVTGEEKGLLGSDYYAHFPTISRDAMVANINMDGATTSYDFADVVALGAEHSSMDAAVRKAAAYMKVKVSPDPVPEQVFFVRSDQYSFVRQGVPAVSVYEGFQAVDPKIDGKKFSENWIDKYYHSPFDDMNQPLNFNAAVKYMKLQFLIGYDVANAMTRPTWNRGDFFGETFAKK